MDTNLRQPRYRRLRASAASRAIFLFVIGARKSAPRKIATGRESMLGARVEVMDDFSERGLVRLHGEIWQAASRVPLTKGQHARIVAIEDLMLTVEKEQA
jgi:membrane-bound serine protease (ClpP class)